MLTSAAVGVQRLGAGASPAAVLRAVELRSRLLGLAPPAALTGSWFGSRAIIAPSVAVQPCEPSQVLASGSRGDALGAVVGGGWFGSLRYPDEGATTAPAFGGWSDSVLRLDADGCWWFESLRGLPCPPDLADAVRAGAEPRRWDLNWTAPDAEAHREAVRSCLAAIAAGELYQACVCTRFTGTFSGAPVGLFADGVESCSPARGAFLEGTWGAIASFSPELFLSRHGDIVRSSPIKGTLPLSGDPALLRTSVKEVAENVMIVDLVRNDLGRVCRVGTVTVPELLTVRAALGVWHLVSTVSGAVRPEVPDARIIDAAGHAALGVGGGITIDSDPEGEWQECLTKAAAVTGLVPAAAPSAAVPVSS